MTDGAATEAAETALQEIFSWLAENAGAAGLGVVRPACKLSLLSDFPCVSHLSQVMKDSGVRRHVYGNYLIFYTVVGRGVRVLRILHGARDVDRIVFPTS